jgi:hypothetical protein
MRKDRLAAWRWWLEVALVGLVASACNTSQSAAPTTVPDAAAACPRRACVPEESEDCDACIEKMGECCYGDHDWQAGAGTFELLVAHCRESSGCTACCNECAAMTCKQMQVNYLCPWVDDKLVLP